MSGPKNALRNRYGGWTESKKARYQKWRKEHLRRKYQAIEYREWAQRYRDAGINILGSISASNWVVPLAYYGRL